MNIALFSAFWLGILTAISPCPLATNIAAISFIGKNIRNRTHILLSGIFYTLGRTFTYILLGAAISSGLFALDTTSRFLMRYMNDILGPLMIILGMILLGWLGTTLSVNLVGEKLRKKAEKGNLFWNFAIGVLFALSFCPASAGLFFAALIPLALKAESVFVIPAVYGLGTGLPVLFFAILIAFSAQYVGAAFNRLTHIEKWIRILAGTLFIIAGIYYCLSHIYGLRFY